MNGLPQLHVGRGTFVDGVTIFPVWTDSPQARGLDTGVEARVSVTERAGSPSVPELVVHNAGPRPALLLEGELLEGGWQHRGLVADVILAPGTHHVLEVACVEHGRWDGAQAHNRRARRAPAGVRAALRMNQQHRQHEVWERVARHERRHGASPTNSLLDHLDAYGEEYESPDWAAAAAILPGQRGVVLGVGGRPLALELFGSMRALRTHLPALLAGARMDAASVPPQHCVPVEGYRARDMAAYLDRADVVPQPTAGTGRALMARTTHADLRGILTDSGVLAHLSVLNTRHPLLVTA